MVNGQGRQGNGRRHCLKTHLRSMTLFSSHVAPERSAGEYISSETETATARATNTVFVQGVTCNALLLLHKPQKRNHYLSEA